MSQFGVKRRGSSGLLDAMLILTGDCLLAETMLSQLVVQDVPGHDHRIRAAGSPLFVFSVVQRPQLPARAMVRLATFVAKSLVEELKRRSDLDPAAASAVNQVMEKRIASDPPLLHLRRKEGFPPQGRE